MAFLLGYDVGSSSIKATLMEAETGRVLASGTMPGKKLEIITKNPSWVEQHPQACWDNVIAATQRIKNLTKFAAADVKAIVISYKTHGSIANDKERKVLRTAIILCGNKTVKISKGSIKNTGKEKLHKRQKRVYLKHRVFKHFMAAAITFISVILLLILAFSAPRSAQQRYMQEKLFEIFSTTWTICVGFFLGMKVKINQRDF